MYYEPKEMGKTVYTQGTFDLFHVGHLNLLERCRKLAGESGRVIVSLLHDTAIKFYKGHDPIIPFEQRKRILEDCKYVDVVIEGDHRATVQEIEGHAVDFVVVGSDWAKKDIYTQYSADKKWLDQYLVFFPYTEDVSTTLIKERIKNDSI